MRIRRAATVSEPSYLHQLAKGLHLVPEQASLTASRVDTLALVLFGASAVLTLAVALLVGWFCLRYRAGSERVRASPASEGMSHRIELAWAGILLVAFLALFAWATKLYLDMYRGPADTHTVDVVAKQWMWKVQHPDGTREINTLHVPAGETIRLRITSQDVIHSVSIPAFRLKRDALPGRERFAWFQASEPGEYHLFCAEYCGAFHARMRGKVVVMEPAAFQRWLDDRAAGDSPVADGRALFRSYGCSGCHQGRSRIRAPNLAGIYGRTVPLSDGSTVRADEAYLRDSILRPNKHVVAGYAPRMPSFSDRIREGELQQIIAYIKSLEPGDWAPQQGSSE